MKTPRIASLFFAAPAVLFAGLLGCGENPVGPGNRGPRIVSLTATPQRVVLGGTTRVSALVADSDGDPITVEWSSEVGSFVDPAISTTFWTAPDSAGIFSLSFTATDGVASVGGQVQVETGNAALTVISDPPGALLTLDGTPTASRTPYTFDPVPPGPHQVTLFNPDFAYAMNSAGTSLVHGQSDTLRFTTAPAVVSNLNLGRSDLLEVGGFAFLPNGIGFIYAGKTTTGTGLFASSVLSVGGVKGALLIPGVNLAEPVSIAADGLYVFYVSESDSIMAAAISDADSDGMTDTVGSPIRLRSGFGPAISASSQLAFTLNPSDQPAASQILWSLFESEALTGLYYGNLNAGRLVTWKPNEPFIAFVRDGTLLFSYTDENGPGGADTLAAGGFNTVPAWGGWGPKHVAYLHGPDASNLNELRLGLPLSEYQVTVAENLMDPRFVAWSSLQRAVSVSYNGGGGPGIYYITNLPIP